MARTFPLAGLLRLRQLQQDRAASELAAANNRMRETAARRMRARAELGQTPLDVFDSATLHAVAAARASSRSMLADLESLNQEQQTAAAQSQAAFNAARAQSVALEKLEARHAETVAAEELHGEQIVLDEIASGGWNRDRQEVRS